MGFIKFIKYIPSFHGYFFYIYLSQSPAIVKNEEVAGAHEYDKNYIMIFLSTYATILL